MSRDNSEIPTLSGLPKDLLGLIFGMAPQLGTTCKKFASLLPPRFVRDNQHFGAKFPSVDSKSKPENLVKINHGGIEFSYEVPENKASKWNGMEPYPHGVGGRPIYVCDFCEKIDDNTTIFGHPYTGGVLFVCQQCKHGLNYRCTQIMGKRLANLVDSMQQIMVPRSNGPNEMWFVGSRLPTIHRGEWHLHVQSRRDLRGEDVLSKVVSVKKLQELNKE